MMDGRRWFEIDSYLTPQARMARARLNRLRREAKERVERLRREMLRRDVARLVRDFSNLRQQTATNARAAA